MVTDRKCEKYANIPTSDLFQPITHVALGAVKSAVVDYISELGYLLEHTLGKRKKCNCVFHCMSV